MEGVTVIDANLIGNSCSALVGNCSVQNDIDYVIYHFEVRWPLRVLSRSMINTGAIRTLVTGCLTAPVKEGCKPMGPLDNVQPGDIPRPFHSLPAIVLVSGCSHYTIYDID